ncbi:hypothetical protein A2334_05985 [Candidatus Roizmanbacteria bacterium RIFOXYB2_FULL_38_10]|uniref:SecA family profile domain-containing protein n=1 Tax=Candidatus Roizmanbacteria bacterium RIFOXYD1_FULL_38_12 TaxID=1802093 RepID=A0A1F7L1V2_9BACT|nr:MAG: hypothetical protein A3K47_04985 [Candidatus Roizmanbacteria bacterium RIFOXYA2_FULL_38_14]OGK65950.1 MAG: hypothetical protein A3K38_04985 [Candidatus Roizmanbacteria bacterium RIFOXYB1_FULL_40_23]OGK68398.1 MAG: hypothetical protein A2334_05985 [Candidatus Roizmanbacteria bacterium RIFOXYB2_FULL_38_10]OGK70355.1 MAG: hypothetical protein A3K21_04990 [Candidatus Roizmanbacteria bacterium RIFOXYC1_FULL_38_14]OGK74097.1 MAG: hypothetical protein A3K52_04985 [Candidatus Roizmanbacteria ba
MQVVETGLQGDPSPQRKRSKVYDPFQTKGFFSWQEKRTAEGWFGTLASIDRSGKMQDEFYTYSLPTIKELRSQYKKTAIKQEKRQKVTERLREGWKSIPKGGEKELQWAEDTTAYMAALYEQHAAERGKKFVFRDNQLCYMTQMLLNKGEYIFGKLETDNRGIQLDTGEGKTEANALIAAMFALQGEKVHILEQSYAKALEHAENIGDFYSKKLGIRVGVATDLSVEENERGGDPVGTRLEYIYKNGKLVPQKGKKAHQEVWDSTILYATTDAVGFTYLDHASQYYQPGKTVTAIDPGFYSKQGRIALVQEADDEMLDRAHETWIQSETIQGAKAWEYIDKWMGIREVQREQDIMPVEERNRLAQEIRKSRKKRKPSSLRDRTMQEIKGFERKTMPSDLRQEITQEILISFWDALYEYKDLFEEGEGRDYFKAGDHIKLSERAYNRASAILQDVLSKINQSYFKFSTDPQSGGTQTRHVIVEQDADMIRCALETVFASEEQKQYLGGKEATLLDESGFPLQKRQLEGLHEVFLRLKNIWEQDEKKERGIDNAQFQLLYDRVVNEMKVSRTTNSVAPIELFKQYKKLRFTSGSLIPVASSYADIYEAEVLRIERHEQVRQPKHKIDTLQTTCLDGGLADVMFVSEERKMLRLFQEAKRIQREGRVGLFIMRDAQEAHLLEQAIKMLNESGSILINQESMEAREEEILKHLLLLSKGKGKEDTVEQRVVSMEEAEREISGPRALRVLRQIKLGDSSQVALPIERPPWLRVVTASEELEERGSLQKALTGCTAGTIVITSQMTRRDFQLDNLEEAVIDRGGPEVFVSGATTERELWQELQRVGRGDIPGLRHLILSEKDIRDPANAYLIDRISIPPLTQWAYGADMLHEKRLKRFEYLWKQAIKGDNEAQTELFQEHLIHLRAQEEERKRALLDIGIKDVRLREWQMAFMGKLDQYVRVMTELSERSVKKTIDPHKGQILIEPAPPQGGSESLIKAGLKLPQITFAGSWLDEFLPARVRESHGIHMAEGRTPLGLAVAKLGTAQVQLPPHVRGKIQVLPSGVLAVTEAASNLPDRMRAGKEAMADEMKREMWSDFQDVLDEAYYFFRLEDIEGKVASLTPAQQGAIWNERVMEMLQKMQFQNVM